MWKPLIGKNSSSAVRKLHLAQMPGTLALRVQGRTAGARLEGCTSPIGFCTAGRASGSIKGDFVFTAHRFVPSDTPGVILYTGEIVFQTSRGEVRCQDAGAYTIDELESGPGAFASVCTITRGTGDWAGATGHIRTYGTFTLAEGGNSHYEGLISR